MLCYQIKNPKVQHNSRRPPHIEGDSLIDSKETIFNNHLSKCFFSIGDEVQFKKPRRNKVVGTVMHIENEFSKVTWTNGGRVPAIITVKIADKVHQKGLTVKTPVKSLIFKP